MGPFFPEVTVTTGGVRAAVSPLSFGDLKVFLLGGGLYCGKFLLDTLNAIFIRSLRSLRTIY